MRIVVVGGGVAGLSSALTLSEVGHQVTVFERDATPLPASADEAFDWDRRGAPQVRHSHAFLARLHGILRDRHPDVLAELLDAGATEMRFGEALPPGLQGFEPEPRDADLVMLACRRTTFEWVLRRYVSARDSVTIQDGEGVRGLVGTPARISGVVLEDGTTVASDLVVVAGGRRSALPDWLAALGAPDVIEQSSDTGIVYYSRFYRLNDGADFPPRGGPIGGDLGYLKYGVFVGDNQTFSVTLACSTDDPVLRKHLASEAGFGRTAESMVVTRAWVEPDRSTPITGVHSMAGLLNRERRFVVDREPVALGVLPVGDARLCTNPLYGRGCSTALWMATILADVIAATDDPCVQALRYHDEVDRQIGPFYRSSVAQDSEARRVAAALLAGEDPNDPDDPRSFMRSVFRDGLLPAMRTDAQVLRAFFRVFNLLEAPDAMMTNTDIAGRVLAAWQDREHRAPEPPLGPDRAELLRILTT